jgi:hypothetical protein
MILLPHPPGGVRDRARRSLHGVRLLVTLVAFRGLCYRDFKL